MPQIQKKSFLKTVCLDIVIPGVFVVLMILALGVMVLNGPFSNFLGIPIREAGVVTIHSLTIFLLSFTFLFFWAKIMRETPLLSRILLTTAFTMIGYTIYDSIWGFFFLYNLRPIVTPIVTISPTNFDVSQVFPSFALWWGIPSAILIFHRFWRPERIPRIRVKRSVFVLVSNFLLILWLASTGFFADYLLYATFSQMEIPAQYAQDPFVLELVSGWRIDPHGWIWFMGKALGMLSWLLVFVNFHKAKRKTVERPIERFVPWHRQHRKRRMFVLP